MSWRNGWGTGIGPWGGNESRDNPWILRGERCSYQHSWQRNAASVTVHFLSLKRTVADPLGHSLVLFVLLRCPIYITATLLEVATKNRTNGDTNLSTCKYDDKGQSLALLGVLPFGGKPPIRQPAWHSHTICGFPPKRKYCQQWQTFASCLELACRLGRPITTTSPRLPPFNMTRKRSQFEVSRAFRVCSARDCHATIFK